MSELLQVRELCVDLHLDGRAPARVLDRVSLSIGRGETLALVGESGCGKSMMAQAIMRILPHSVARIAGGVIDFAGKDLVSLGEREMRKLRGGAISMVFQEPMSALNPVLSIGEQIVEGIMAHRHLSRKQAREEALRLLEAVHIADPARKLDEYPHRLSGGMRQRVVIAMALACEPELLVADEPTTALDVTVQAQILRLVREAREKSGMAQLLITHNLGVVAEIADRVAVMYAGRIVEEGSVDEVLLRPAHPYTKGLLAATPRFVREPGAAAHALQEIPGMVPSPHERGMSCTFAARCTRVRAQCHSAVPSLCAVATDASHRVACFATETQP